MKKTNRNKLDKEEQILNAALERGEFKSVPNVQRKIAEIKNIVKSSRTQNINLRVDTAVLESIKEKADRSGLPYQTLIKAVLHQYANGKINIML